MNNIALITGATAGIGEATALLFARHGFRLILTGRRHDRLEKLATDIASTHPVDVKTLSFDIRNLEETQQAFKALPREWQNIDVLINNAGLAAGLDPIHEGNVEDWETMIDTNVKGLLYMTRLVSPLMVARKKGHIINIGSIAGKESYPKGNVYCGTKHAVEGITKGMRLDLAPHNIKVSSICPGAVETEFSMVRFKGDTTRADSVYEGFTPLYAEDIAEAILFAATRPPHVTINDMLIMPTAQANATTIIRD
ncbi:MAG: SDR family oxidoreductase [Bacteroidota bacterium]